MGHLKDIANQSKIQTFPNATFEIAGEVPLPQCSEAHIQGEFGQTTLGLAELIDLGAFANHILFDTLLHITSPPPNVGIYDILSNTGGRVVLLQPTPITSNVNHYFISNPIPANIAGVLGITLAFGTTLTQMGSFGAFNLTGKILNITHPPGNDGQYEILSNTADVLNLDHQTPIASIENHWFVPTAPEITITRNLQSFAQFIHNAGYAYTIKGAKLYTNIPSEFLQPACTILFDPLT